MTTKVVSLDERVTLVDVPIGKDSDKNLEVGRKIGLTRERVRQIQVEALRTLREIMELNGLSGKMIFEDE
jgi:DNA-directed RNA polymerase sigma subunit (sigma70/sigma32)